MHFDDKTKKTVSANLEGKTIIKRQFSAVMIAFKRIAAAGLLCLAAATAAATPPWFSNPGDVSRNFHVMENSYFLAGKVSDFVPAMGLTRRDGVHLIAAVDLSGAATDQTVRLVSADLSQPKGPLNAMFKSCVGAGRANEGLRADWQRQLAYVHRECGFQ